jgi:hypothetical protein
MTATEVKDALRKRHPATQKMGALTIPGPWTCIEEWRGVDLLALCATTAGRVRNARVGYEVKVSRGDYRSELKNPHKRAEARAFCHEFYFAVPDGLLRVDELPGKETQAQLGEKSLFVPDDVGLVVVTGRGCRVVKRSPLVADPEPITTEPGRGLAFATDVNALCRWVSARPDPRHQGIVDEARRKGREIAEHHRERERAFKELCDRNSREATAVATSSPSRSKAPNPSTKGEGG